MESILSDFHMFGLFFGVLFGITCTFKMLCNLELDVRHNKVAFHATTAKCLLSLV